MGKSDGGVKGSAVLGEQSRTPQTTGSRTGPLAARSVEHARPVGQSNLVRVARARKLRSARARLRNSGSGKSDASFIQSCGPAHAR